MDIVYQAEPLGGLLNIASILLGLAALVFAVHSLQVRGCLICCTLSGSLTGLSLLLQLMELNRLAGIEDTSAILDTLYGRCLAGIALLAIISVLNVLALLRGRKKGCTSC